MVASLIGSVVRLRGEPASIELGRRGCPPENRGSIRIRPMPGRENGSGAEQDDPRHVDAAPARGARVARPSFPLYRRANGLLPARLAESRRFLIFLTHRVTNAGEKRLFR